MIPGSGRSPGEGNGNPLQYSCLENPMDGGAWLATVHRVTKSRTRLNDFTHSLIHNSTVKNCEWSKILSFYKLTSQLFFLLMATFSKGRGHENPGSEIKKFFLLEQKC